MQRRAVTLLELLIVMVILLMVTAAAIPIVVPATRNRQMRESVRIINGYLGAAKARAVQTGRPCGVIIERENGQAFAFRMAQIEVPPPYAGDTSASRTFKIQAVATPPSSKTAARAVGPYIAWFTVSMNPADFNYRIIKIGDVLHLGDGKTYTILGPDEPTTVPPDGIVDSSDLEVAFVSESPIATPFITITYPSPYKNYSPWPSDPVQAANFKVPYKITRQPIRTSSPPLSLPDGICFDLSVSCIGSMLYNTRDYSGVLGPTVPDPIVASDPIVIFSPAGRVDFITNSSGALVRPTDSIYLLVGKRELMFDATTKGVQSDIVFQNLSPIPNPATSPAPPAENFWITIGYQTGLVTTSEVAQNFQDYQGTSGASTFKEVRDLALFGNASYSGALKFAKESQSYVGR